MANLNTSSSLITNRSFHLIYQLNTLLELNPLKSTENQSDLTQNCCRSTVKVTVEPRLARWIRTVLETLIYNAVVNAFVKGLKIVTRVFPVAPLGECFSSKNTGSTHVDFVLQEKNVFWRIYGANSMVKVSNEVLCLGIVDGGRSRVMTNIVIGGHQIEDNLLEFDIEESRLRFSSSLLVYSTSGAKFKFMSNA